MRARPAKADHQRAGRTGCWTTPKPPTVKEGHPRRSGFPVGKDWGTGAYVVGHAWRPSARCCRAADAGSRHRPENGSGIDKKTPHARGQPFRRRPFGGVPKYDTESFPSSKLGGLNPGEDAKKIVVAAVDVGILNLTNYKAADAGMNYYLGQRRIDFGNPRPLRAIDRRHAGYPAGQIKTGGDSAGRGAAGQSANAEEAAGRFYIPGLSRWPPTAQPKISFEIPEASPATGAGDGGVSVEPATQTRSRLRTGRQRCAGSRLVAERTDAAAPSCSNGDHGNP